MRERLYDIRKMLGSDGETYTVREIEELLTTRTKEGVSYIPGMRRLELESGEEVIMLDNRLTIMPRGVTLTEID